MTSDDKEWIEQRARELAEQLEGALRRGGITTTLVYDPEGIPLYERFLQQALDRGTQQASDLAYDAGRRDERADVERAWGEALEIADGAWDGTTSAELALGFFDRTFGQRMHVGLCKKPDEDEG